MYTRYGPQPLVSRYKFSEMNTVQQYSIRVVFRRIPPRIRTDLLEFWEKHRENWIDETTRPPHTRHIFSVENTHRARSSALLTNVVCVAYSDAGVLVGVAWMKTAIMQVDTAKPELIYFQRMYIAPEHRFAWLANQLFGSFIHIVKSTNTRSPLIQYLLAENVNIKLKTPVGRRLFIRRGYQFMGTNFRGNEIWKLPLPPIKCPSINAPFSI